MFHVEHSPISRHTHPQTHGWIDPSTKHLIELKPNTHEVHSSWSSNETWHRGYRHTSKAFDCPTGNVPRGTYEQIYHNTAPMHNTWGHSERIKHLPSNQMLVNPDRMGAEIDVRSESSRLPAGRAGWWNPFLIKRMPQTHGQKAWTQCSTWNTQPPVAQKRVFKRLLNQSGLF